MKHNTICILGGGPAGLTTALALRRYGFSVTVFESTSYDSYRAGEHIIPESLPILNALEVPERIIEKNGVRCFAVDSIWGSDTFYSRDSIFNVFGEGFLLNRPAFDRELAGYVQSQGVNLRIQSKVRSFELSDGGWLVHYRSQFGSKSLNADFLIDATGKNSQFVSNFKAKKVRFDNLIGITGYFKQETEKPNPKGSILVEAVEDGWWYSTVLRGDTLVATFMTDGDLLDKAVTLEENFQFFLEQSEVTKSILNNYQIVEGVRAASAVTQIQSRLVGERCLAVGDAAWSVDPLSSQGIYKAITMGTKAAEVVRAHFTNTPLALENYEKEQFEKFHNYLIQRADYYRMETRWSESIFWKRRRVPC